MTTIGTPDRWLLAAALVALLASGLLRAQDTRIVQGQVLDENSKVVEGAIVHLKEKASDKALIVATDKEGRYQFNGVSKKIDYTVYALLGERRSNERSVSSFDSRSIVRINLRFPPPEEETPPGTQQPD